MKRFFAIIALLPGMFLATGCGGIPEGVAPVSGFELERYLGTWYEIARLDHRFERGLENVSAHYSRVPGGGIRVVNRGYDPQKRRWKTAEGRARFIGDERTGQLEVSFFGPFFGGYNVIELDHAGYRYALVCGPNRSYLWLLARRPDLDAGVVNELVARAAELGFDTGALIYVHHEPGRPATGDG